MSLDRCVHHDRIINVNINGICSIIHYEILSYFIKKTIFCINNKKKMVLHVYALKQNTIIINKMQKTKQVALSKID